jgi:hypothetical protein
VQKIFWIFILGIVFIQACKQTPKRPEQLEPAFYYWRTNFDLVDAQKESMEELGTQTLFIKFMDIGRNEQNKLIQVFSRLQVSDTAALKEQKLIPCFFITNSVFKNINPSEEAWLVKTIASSLNANANLNKSGNAWPEVQLDCDWTPETKDAYFRLVQTINTNLSTQTLLSTTIRLHQYKFPTESGVPPADRGMLMLYNTGDIENWKEDNSILSVADAKKYIQGAPDPYPLALDLALPVFSWGLVYRDGGLWKILPALDKTELQDTSFFKPSTEQPGNWDLVKPTIREGHYLREGDQIRFEEVDFSVLQEIQALSQSIRVAPDARMAFFHLDPQLKERYSIKDLRTLCQ